MKWQVIVEIDDPKNLIKDYKSAESVVYDLIGDTEGLEIAESCDFEVTMAKAIAPESNRDLVVNQKGLLIALRNHGKWYIGCDWYWDTTNDTREILDSLVRRDLVQKKKGVYTPV